MFRQVNLELEEQHKKFLQARNHTGPVTRTHHFNQLSAVSDKTALFTCPFNIGHVVKKGGYIKHINKCKKNASFQQWVECPYNFGHQFPTLEDLRSHIASGDCIDAEEQSLRIKEIVEFNDKKKKKY